MKQLWKMLLPLRGLAILLVVLGHSSSILLHHDARFQGEGIVALNLGDTWSLPSPLLTICLEIARVSVPLFLFLSGHYLAHTLPTRHGLWTSLTKFLYPMVFWSLASWAVSFRHVEGGWSLPQFLNLFARGEAQLGYYFLILIVQYYVLAPWLVAMVRRSPRATLAGALLIQLLVQLYDYSSVHGGHGGVPHLALVETLGSCPECLFPRFVFFVVLGIWAGLNPEPLRVFVGTRLPQLVVATLAALLLMVMESSHIFRTVYTVEGMAIGEAISRAVVPWKFTTTLWAICAILLLLALSARDLPSEQRLKWLGHDAYMIFLLHGMVLTVVEIVLTRLQAPSYFCGAGGLVLLILFGIVTPLLVGNSIRHLVRSRLLRRILLGD